MWGAYTPFAIRVDFACCQPSKLLWGFIFVSKQNSMRPEDEKCNWKWPIFTHLLTLEMLHFKNSSKKSGRMDCPILKLITTCKLFSSFLWRFQLLPTGFSLDHHCISLAADCYLQKKTGNNHWKTLEPIVSYIFQFYSPPPPSDWRVFFLFCFVFLLVVSHPSQMLGDRVFCFI